MQGDADGHNAGPVMPLICPLIAENVGHSK